MSAWRSAVAVLGLVTVLGCKEQLTTPGRCPELCPSGNVVLVDTLLTTMDVSDTSLRGYVLVKEAAYLLAANLDSLQSVVAMRFTRRDTSWFPDAQDTAYVGTQDSVLLTLQVLQRDTSIKQIKLLVYRLPMLFDTTGSYAALQPFLVDSNLVDTIALSDTVQFGAFSFRIADSLVIPAADSGQVSLAIALTAGGKTALTVGSGNIGTSAPVLSYYVHARAPLDTLSKSFSVDPILSLFAMSPPPGQPPPGVLAVGGIPTARATLRLSLPKVVVDSNAIVRATLLLNSVSPAGGFAHDTFTIIAQPVVRDFGVKSVLWPDSAVSGFTRMTQGQTGPVELDIGPILRFWGTTVGDSTPRLIVIRVFPEGSILGSAAFAGRATGATGPQLRVTYVKPYTFGLP